MVQGSLPNDPRPSVSGVLGQAGTGFGSMIDRLRSSLLPDPYRSSNWSATAEGERTIAQRLVDLIPRLLLCATILFLAAAIGLFAFRAMYNDKIYPAVVIGDVNVGGLTADQAREKVNQRAADLEQGSVNLSYGGQTWTPTLSELGVSVDTDTSVAQAKELGRDEDAVSRLTFTGDILQGDQQVPLTMTLDEGVLNAWFDTVDQNIGDPATDAAIVIDGTTVTVTPDATGTLVDRESAQSMIMGALASLTPVSGDLPTVISPPAVTVADLESTAAELDNALSQSVSVEVGGQSWRIDPDTFAQYLSVTTTSEGQIKTTVNVDDEGLAQELRDTFENDVNTDPVNARIVWDETEGGLVARDSSTDGRVLKGPEFAEAVSASFLGDHDRVEIPVAITKPEIDSNNLDALNIDHQISRGDSNYDPSTDQRIVNIGVGVGLLNGTLVKPGEDFSFNQAIGEITADKGYVEASVVVAERAGRDIGGGICQVSTTVFRAALMGGFPIGQWNPHTYRIKGYEKDGWGPGFDASILQQEGVDPAYWGDFIFTNNTDGWLLIQSWASYPYVVVEIYGQDDGREIEIFDEYQSEPIIVDETIEYVDPAAPPGTMELSETPLAGLEWGYMRTVTYPDGSGKENAERWFGNDYSGRGNVWRVSPDMEGESPGG